MNSLASPVLVIGLLIATFNYNLPVLTRNYKGISNHRFRDWLFWGLGGRLVLGTLFFLLYCSTESVDNVFPFAEKLFVLAFLLTVNAVWTYHEVVRDRKRYYSHGLVDYEWDADLSPFELVLDAVKEFGYEIAWRTRRAWEVIFHRKRRHSR